MNTETVELEVPDESLEALRLSLEYAFETDDECVQRIATPIVAAELRRLADAAEWRISPEALRARADELEAGQ